MIKTNDLVITKDNGQHLDHVIFVKISRVAIARYIEWYKNDPQFVSYIVLDDEEDFYGPH
jgi:hypothetical protein